MLAFGGVARKFLALLVLAMVSSQNARINEHTCRSLVCCKQPICDDCESSFCVGFDRYDLFDDCVDLLVIGHC